MDFIQADASGRVTSIGEAATQEQVPIETVGERGEILADFINASSEELRYVHAVLVNVRAEIRAIAAHALHEDALRQLENARGHAAITKSALR